MGSHYLSKRDNWQEKANADGACGELSVGDILTALPDYIDVQNRRVPKIPVYSNGKGVVMDGVIFNERLRTFTFVETKTGNAGSGNAHERAGKFLSPALRSKMRSISSTPEYLRKLTGWSGSDVTDYQPSEDLVFFFFTGKTFLNQKNIEEINMMFDGFPAFNMSVDGPQKVAEKVKLWIDK